MRRVDGMTQLLFYLLLCNSVAALADDSTPSPTPPAADPTDPDESAAGETPTGGFWGLNDRLAEYAVEVALGATNIYQSNVRGGLDTHGRTGRFSGSYDLEIAADLEKLLGLGRLGLFVHAEGGWPDAEGIDGSMVGSFFGVNADAGGNRTLDVVEVVFEWQVLDGALILLAGKMDFAGVFDTSEYANDETSQFLNGALINNPTIPLPDYCLGVILTANLTEAWSVSAGVGDAEADGRTTGFSTAFHGPDYSFYVVETGIRTGCNSACSALAGSYRLGLWYDPQPKAHSDSETASRDDVGFYVSLDQTLVKENDDPEDSQGLGTFARYGWANETRNDLSSFWSIGMQYQGLLDNRDDDVLGLGFALCTFSDEASVTFCDDHESVTELYYNMEVASWMTLSPSVQYVTSPGGGGTATSALIVGARAQILF